MRTIHKAGVGAASAAAVIAVAVNFTPTWEGMDPVARRDPIGTGHPITYCYGQTDEFGKVKVGTRFTKQECDEKLKQSMPKYLAEIGPCVKRPVPVKAMSALVDAAYNAGSARVCRSPMVAKINAGSVRAGCDAFDGWIIRGNGQVHRGLIARRAGEKHGDHRKSERALCLEGLSEPLSGLYLYKKEETNVDVNRAAKADRGPVPAAPHYRWTDYVRNWWRLHFS